ncbi:MAG TPA: FAD-dependent oxidoreductase, partial [Macromonas sp.]|nr:FAD-dependent oxidoreductase [Macromonas sp.]
NGCDVTVLEAGDRVMARFFPPKLSEMLAAVHQQQGVKLLTGVGITSITQRGAESVIALADGTTLVADAVIVGIGAQPNTALAEASGLTLRQGGVEVDETAQTSAAGVYAAGDVATFRLAGADWIRWENWTHARQQAAHAARHMLGKGTEYHELPWVWSDQYDMNIQVLGSPVSDDPVVLRGSLEGGRLAAFHRSKGKLVGATLINDGKHKSPIRKLIEKQAVVPPEQLSDAAVDLKKLAAQF